MKAIEKEPQTTPFKKGCVRCCCKCVSRVEVFKHPWNSGVFKGAISERLGFGCSVFGKLCFLIMNMASAKHLLKRNYKKLYIMNDLNKEKSTMEAFENLSKRIRAVFKKGGDTQEVLIL
jgi:hypothetical protein